MTSDRSLLAYLAGAIDSDGCITVAMNSRYDNYQERVQLSQVTPEIPHLLKAEFGGTLYLHNRSSGRPLWGWAVSAQKAVTCLEALLPYLRVKRLQAENCLELRELIKENKKRRGVARTPELAARLEVVKARARELNH